MELQRFSTKPIEAKDLISQEQKIQRFSTNLIGAKDLISKEQNIQNRLDVLM
jgi:hypothetical protein